MSAGRWPARGMSMRDEPPDVNDRLTSGPDAIDAAIDRAARSMTDTPVPPRLRAEVRSRITSGRHDWVLPLWMPAAAAAIVVLLIVGSGIELGPPSRSTDMASDVVGDAAGSTARSIASSERDETARQLAMAPSAAREPALRESSKANDAGAVPGASAAAARAAAARIASGASQSREFGTGRATVPSTTVPPTTVPSTTAPSSRAPAPGGSRAEPARAVAALGAAQSQPIQGFSASDADLLRPRGRQGDANALEALGAEPAVTAPPPAAAAQANASAGSASAGQPVPAAPAQLRSATVPGESRNVRYDISIADTVGGRTTTKVVTMNVVAATSADVRLSGLGSIRSSALPFATIPGSNPAQPGVSVGGPALELNVDVTRPLLQADGKVRTVMVVEYQPYSADATRSAGSVRASVDMLLEDGRKTIVSQTADPVSDRKVVIEVTATIAK